MPTNYTIYLVNESASTQVFWAFLAPPPELAGDPAVYANSSVNLAVAPNDPGTNSITIPVEYVVGDGASNEAVGLNVLIESSAVENAFMTQVWQADYANSPPNMGPSLSLSPDTTGADSFAIVSNAFDQINNEDNGWFGNMSYGIETDAGFMGMTWSPSPNQTQTLTPTLSFYVNTGSFGSNVLADWTDVTNDAAELAVPASFGMGACTVTYTETGDWEVTPGAPA